MKHHRVKEFLGVFYVAIAATLVGQRLGAYVIERGVREGYPVWALLLTSVAAVLGNIGLAIRALLWIRRAAVHDFHESIKKAALEWAKKQEKGESHDHEQ